ncbi:hypothetical protein Aple_046470 [Acrocarpospora pleiomorpha]|uniref:Uncharacterized protein n=1 Tax=Acrocarpospora pleiomorpha TaxID=90975 RepID=A0A5M3XQ10_9ACTN|nr:hypothetical protein Aple_046470 [Acrocarpospora pleiomorpha]
MELLRLWHAAGSPLPQGQRPDLSPGTTAKIYRSSIKPVSRAAMHEGENGEPPLLFSTPCDGFHLPTAPVTTPTVEATTPRSKRQANRPSDPTVPAKPTTHAANAEPISRPTDLPSPRKSAIPRSSLKPSSLRLGSCP